MVMRKKIKTTTTTTEKYRLFSYLWLTLCFIYVCHVSNVNSMQVRDKHIKFEKVSDIMSMSDFRPQSKFSLLLCIVLLFIIDERSRQNVRQANELLFKFCRTFSSSIFVLEFGLFFTTIHLKWANFRWNENWFKYFFFFFFGVVAHFPKLYRSNNRTENKIVHSIF